ncbi:U32 family peptidase [Photobacterium japonica]|uniref:peptidase U32 family protein n=1 Tax=Photobacterium japonica TaxID=2910235 RepID=UPI003D0D3626
MKNKFELLAPGGDIESIKAAIVAGADAIYCGLDHFNARNRAANLTFDDLNGIVRLAHQYDCKIFLTLNVIILEREIPAVIALLNQLVNTKIDGVILQDLGLFYILKKHFPTLDVHASTQVNTHNEGQIRFMGQLGASRVNLSRELNIQEIKHLAQFGLQHNVLMEVFVHGSYCIGFSGLCYMSSVRNGNSGNRGRCSQPCRDKYQVTDTGTEHPLNMKDNSAFGDMAALADAGVYSLKVEGRIKKSHYVYTVVDNWRQQIDRYCNNEALLTDTTELYTVFNRDFSNAYLTGEINKGMFIDNPRDHSVKHFTTIHSCTTPESVQGIKKKLYDDKTDIIQTVEARTHDLNIAKLPLSVTVSAVEGKPLSVTITGEGCDMTLTSDVALVQSHRPTLSHDAVQKWVAGFANCEYAIAEVDVSGVDESLYMPYKEQTEMREQIAIALNGGKPLVAPVTLPAFTSAETESEAANEQAIPSLSVLISSVEDVALAAESDATLYYQMPEAMAMNLTAMQDLFSANPHLIPWFPAILIGDHYQAAVTFLETVKPVRIVTNNFGMGFAAHALGIDWIAGPHMNITNSYSLLCLKEEFGCKGAFISNEINRTQVKQIVKPADFELHYSVYHPIMLMTSRQCFFLQTVGCKKKRFDDKCLRKCDKTASILSLKGENFVLAKQRGDHNAMYSQTNYLNTDVMADQPLVLNGVMIDLRNIKTDTKISGNKADVIAAFQQQIAQQDGQPLHAMITPSTKAQYKKGL